MLRGKQGGIKYHLWVFGMPRPGIEPRSSGPLANNQLIRKKKKKNTILDRNLVGMEFGNAIAIVQEIEIWPFCQMVYAQTWICPRE